MKLVAALCRYTGCFKWTKRYTGREYWACSWKYWHLTSSSQGGTSQSENKKRKKNTGDLSSKRTTVPFETSIQNAATLKSNKTLCPHFEGYGLSVFPLRINGLKRLQGGSPLPLALGRECIWLEKASKYFNASTLLLLQSLDTRI